MKKKTIIGTDLSVSQLCLGGGIFVDHNYKKENTKLIDFFIENGGNFIDTANIYGKWLPEQTASSELFLGEYYKTHKHNMIISTKGAHPNLGTMHTPRLSFDEIKHDLCESLRNLQVETIDLYWLHRDDITLPVGNIIDSLNTLITEGKIRYFGVSNWTVTRIKQANEYAKKNNLMPIGANQPGWSLAHPNIEKFEDKTLKFMDDEMLQYHRESKLTCIPYSSQAGGFLQKLNDKVPISHGLKEKYYNETNLKTFEMLQKDGRGTINQLSLAHLMNQSFSTIPIVGCKTIEQLKDSIAACDIIL